MLFARLLMVTTMITCSAGISASHRSPEKSQNRTSCQALQKALGLTLQDSKTKFQFNKNNNAINPILKLIESHVCSKNEKDDQSFKNDQKKSENTKFNDFALHYWTP